MAPGGSPEHGSQLLVGLFVSLGSFVLLTVILVAGLGGICCCKRRRKYSYSSMGRNRVSSDGASIRIIGGHSEDERESGFYEALKQQQQAEQQGRRDTALLDCQFFLRSNPHFALEQQLPDIGSRMSKKWFLVRQTSTVPSPTTSCLMTMVPLSPSCKLDLRGEDREVFHRLIHSLQHPFVHLVTTVNYVADKNLVVLIEPFSERGSLKDIIYNTTPGLSWSSKYSVRRHGLKLSQVRTYGRQVLEGMLHLHNVGLCPMGQLQSGNVYLFNNRCRVSGYENMLLGYKPRIHNLIKREKNIDTAMFGHLLYEMASGRELAVSHPSDTDLQLVKQSQVVEVLRVIFDSEKDCMPSLQQILQLPFFQQASVPELINWSYEEIQLSDEVRALIRRTKRSRARSIGSSTNAAAGKKRKEESYPVFQGRKTSVSSSVPKTTPPLSSSQSAEKKLSKSVPAPDPASPPPPTEQRNALLSHIRQGTSLRPTITDDRSAPII